MLGNRWAIRIINYIDEENRNFTYDEYCTCNEIFTTC